MTGRTLISSALDAYLEERRAEIDAALDRVLPRPEQCRARVVAEAMRYSVFAGGKRLRPTLALAAAEATASLAGPDNAEAEPDRRARAMPAACAVELIHTYSLIHDDLPAMDNDTLRRGRPTAHVAFGEGIAILAGDALLTLAFEVMASAGGSPPGGRMAEPRLGAEQSGASEMPASEPRGGAPRAGIEADTLRAIALIAHAAGVAGMVGGQTIDLQAVGGSATFEAGALEEMHAMKTGALIRAAAASGALLAGAAEPIVDAVDRYAAELGLAFQIVDDILDVEGKPDALGKTAGKDAAAGKPTYAARYGIAESKRMAHDCIARAEAALASAGVSGRLPEIARWVVARSA